MSEAIVKKQCALQTPPPKEPLCLKEIYDLQLIRSKMVVKYLICEEHFKFSNSYNKMGK